MTVARPAPIRRSCPVLSDDQTLAWVYAANCSLYEEDPDPPYVNIGSPIEPVVVSRTEAYRDLYARLLLLDFDADPQRITALTRLIDRAERHSPTAALVWSIAAELCQRAGAIIDGAGASKPGPERRRLLAGTKYLTRTVILGQWVPAYQAELDDEFLNEFAANDD